MAQVLIRRLDEKTVKQLKKTAKAAGRSLEEECRQALERWAKMEELDAAIERWKAEDTPNPWHPAPDSALPNPR